MSLLDGKVAIVTGGGSVLDRPPVTYTPVRGNRSGYPIGLLGEPEEAKLVIWLSSE